MRDALRWLESDDRAAGFVRISLSVGAFLLLWWVLTATVVTNRMILVPPQDVLAALVKEFNSGAIAKNAAATGLAVAVSFPVAVILGVLMGVALASNRRPSLAGMRPTGAREQAKP